MRFSLALLPILLAGCATSQPNLRPEARLHAETYGPKRGINVRTLIVVLHGDSAANHYRFAKAAAGAIPDAAAIAILRPGYADAAGRRSPGESGAAGDNYTPDRIAAVGDAIEALRARYPRAQTIVVGDAGGAAVAANLAGVRPSLINGMVLVGCPCTLSEWRQQMNGASPAATAGLDPLKTAGGIQPGLRAAVLVGADDKVTPIAFSRAYAEALTLRGVATDYRILPGRGHELLDDPEVLAATQRLAAALPRKG
jgi:pimeloyl-ACP methyl ester carboxylesterase